MTTVGGVLTAAGTAAVGGVLKPVDRLGLCAATGAGLELHVAVAAAAALCASPPRAMALAGESSSSASGFICVAHVWRVPSARPSSAAAAAASSSVHRAQRPSPFPTGSGASERAFGRAARILSWHRRELAAMGQGRTDDAQGWVGLTHQRFLNHDAEVVVHGMVPAGLVRLPIEVVPAPSPAACAVSRVPKGLTHVVQWCKRVGAPPTPTPTYRPRDNTLPLRKRRCSGLWACYHAQLGPPKSVAVHPTAATLLSLSLLLSG